MCMQMYDLGTMEDVSYLQTAMACFINVLNGIVRPLLVSLNERLDNARCFDTMFERVVVTGDNASSLSRGTIDDAILGKYFFRLARLVDRDGNLPNKY